MALESLGIVRLEALHYYVHDLARSRRFYTEKFDFAEVGGSDEAVAVTVRDHGVGLRPGESSLVFNRFWRADPARARTTGGTGLGLAIALEDATLHGGWLQAWGRTGQGALFRLTLPRYVRGPLRRSPLPLVPDDVTEPVA